MTPWCSMTCEASTIREMSGDRTHRLPHGQGWRPYCDNARGPSSRPLMPLPLPERLKSLDVAARPSRLATPGGRLSWRVVRLSPALVPEVLIWIVTVLSVRFFVSSVRYGEFEDI